MARFTRILSIDGGGIRGIIPAQILVELERRLRKIDDNSRIADHFDLIAGTSTGGILTCIYLCPDASFSGRPGFNAEQAAELFLERGDEIFEIPLLHRLRSVGGLLDEKYPAKGLEDALDDYLGNFMLSELIKPCLITAYDIKRRSTCFFTQHDARKSKARDFHLRDVARATSAAPTYFECVTIRSATNKSHPMIDGGVFANNPALCAYAEVRSMEEHAVTAKDMVILSLGTGEVKKSYNYKEAKDWGALEWIKPLLDIMMSGVAETVDYQLRQMFDAVEASNQYLRIQPKLQPENEETDNAESENLKALKKIGSDIVKDSQIDKALDNFVKLLMQ